MRPDFLKDLHAPMEWADAAVWRTLLTATAMAGV